MSENWGKIGTGAILEDKFRIIKNLDPGGGGPVFSAILIKSNSILHLRFFSEKEIPDEKALDDCLTKAKKAFSVSRDTVTLPFDHGFYNGIPYVAYALSNLKTMHQFFQSGEKLGIQEGRKIIEALLTTLKKVHTAGVCHLGLSPISIHQRQGGFAAAGLGIIDFGLAGASGHDYFTRPSNDPDFLNIAGYASPEQAAMSDEIDHRSDLYSVGAIAYRILIGKDPFTGTSPGDILVKVMSEMPEGLDEEKRLSTAMRNFLILALQKDPEDRFDSAAEMLDAYKKALASGPEIAAHVPKKEERVSPPAAPREEKKEPKKTAIGPPPLEARVPKPPPSPARMVEKRVEKKAEEQLGQKLPDLAAGRPLKGAVPEPASTKDLLPEPFMEKAMPERPAEAPPAEARRPAEARPSPPGRSRQARAAAPAVAKAAGPIMPMLLAEAKNVWKKLITRAGTLTRSGFAQAQRGLLAFWTFLRSRALELKNLLSPRKGIWIGSALIVLVVAAAVVIAFVVLRGPAHSSGQKEKSSGQQQPEPEKPKTENQKGIPLSAAQEKTQEGKEQGETGPGKKVSASPTPPVHPPATAPKEGTKPPVPKETAEKENKTVPVSKAGSVEAKAESKPAAEVEKKSAPEVQEEEESAPEGRPKKKKRKKVDLSGLKILD